MGFSVICNDGRQRSLICYLASSGRRPARGLRGGTRRWRTWFDLRCRWLNCELQNASRTEKRVELEIDRQPKLYRRKYFLSFRMLLLRDRGKRDRGTQTRFVPYKRGKWQTHIRCRITRCRLLRMQDTVEFETSDMWQALSFHLK